MMDTNASRHQGTASFRQQNARRIGFSTVLLAIGAVWLFGIAYFILMLLPEGRQVVPIFVFVVVLLAVTTYATTQRGERNRQGQLLLWWLFGSTLSIWMIGIFSIGWFFFPVWLLELFALIAWPRPRGVSIISKTGMIAEIAGFLSVPGVFVLSVILTGGF